MMSFFLLNFKRIHPKPVSEPVVQNPKDGQVWPEVHTVHGIYRWHISSLYLYPRCFSDGDTAWTSLLQHTKQFNALNVDYLFILYIILRHALSVNPSVCFD